MTFQTILISGIVISLTHALLPNHWLPILAIGRKERWTFSQTMFVTAIAGAAHTISTLLLGWGLSLGSGWLSRHFESFLQLVMPMLLLGMGAFFIWQHYHHRHFHVQVNPSGHSLTRTALLLATAMFFSPCLEVETLFAAAGALGNRATAILSAVYALTTLCGMILWVAFAWSSVSYINWHRIEHNAGLLAGGVLIATAILSFFVR
jgi:nickel/cobalt transporter (NicO) family protein